MRLSYQNWKINKNQKYLHQEFQKQI